ncbi:hypothetical protein [Leisingera daeponensis]|uniref:hypothetical protein n=1 Tax=Leisingera daeponensis TaxID=405746 RepID=UPI001C945EEB|nr:hypothetical protein [Leisingera daeponensis]MBY6055373.1 hypothetical protein [Leisingera daeponensis]
MEGSFSEILAALGGGVPAVVIIGLAVFSWRLLHWWREDTKEHSATVRDITREATEGLHASAEATRALTEEIKRRD